MHRRTGEAFYVIEGTLKIRLDDEHRLATPGSFIFVPPRGCAHVRSRGARPSAVPRHSLATRAPRLLQGHVRTAPGCAQWWALRHRDHGPG
ncbi:MAG: cupin domain-containing protein [Pseudonocardiaceae bacterium]